MPGFFLETSIGRFICFSFCARAGGAYLALKCDDALDIGNSSSLSFLRDQNNLSFTESKHGQESPGKHTFS
ncbi:hypothetical protein KSF_011730 [Reticulibacter mediterranei]|uniref:Uncharacterized protein n=1 Tax=Reticulibacter mediterranei TaxID=2778369 RepID=A0A8J3II05_9CHLR|nr:hypothetical protein KSF_011730 [Reticulibacter mediterranei]